MGTASLTLGIVGIFASAIPSLSLPVGIVGLILGILARMVYKKQKRRAVAGIVMCSLTIAMSIWPFLEFIVNGPIIEGMFPGYS